MAEFRPVPIDFSALANLPQRFQQGQQWRTQQDLSRVNAFNPDNTVNYQAIWKIDPDTAIKALTANSLAGYRGALTAAIPTKNESPTVKTIEYLKENFPQYFQQPERLGPPDTSKIDSAVAQADAEAAGTAPTPVPGTSTLRYKPAIIQNQLMSNEGLAQAKAEGTGEGQRQSMMQGLKEQSPGAQSLLNNAFTLANTADSDTFQNALGPLQGGPTAETWQGALGQQATQTAGALSNYFDQGMKGGFVDWKTGNVKSPGELPGGFTSTLRSNINSTSASLINMFQRFLRVQGIGSQSDKELQQLVDQAGDLTKARTQEDFNDRMKNLVTNMKALGFDVRMPEGGPIGKDEARYTNSAETMQGSTVPDAIDKAVGPTEPQPPTPPTRALNALRAYAKDPAARKAFDEIYGPGASEFYLQKSR